MDRIPKSKTKTQIEESAKAYIQFLAVVVSIGMLTVFFAGGNTNTTGKAVAESSCYDGIQNNDETGIDCGGACSPCPSCDDNIRNQGEMGVDCGGPCWPCTGLQKQASASSIDNSTAGLSVSEIGMIAGALIFGFLAILLAKKHKDDEKKVIDAENKIRQAETMGLDKQNERNWLISQKIPSSILAKAYKNIQLKDAKEYILSKKKNGMQKQQIIEELIRNNWSKNDAKNAVKIAGI